MVERLKRAHYRRRFGRECGDLVLEMERAMRALPREEISEAWVDWFWRQPPERWAECMAARQRGETVAGEPEFQWDAVPAPRTLSEARAVGLHAKIKTEEIEASIRRSLEGLEGVKFRLPAAAAPVPDRLALAAAALERAAQIVRSTTPPYVEPEGAKAKAWDQWIASLPVEDRDGGVRVRGLFSTMEAVHREMVAQPPEKRMNELRCWARACEREYLEVAEPLFERHGRPV